METVELQQLARQTYLRKMAELPDLWQRPALRPACSPYQRARRPGLVLAPEGDWCWCSFEELCTAVGTGGSEGGLHTWHPRDSGKNDCSHHHGVELGRWQENRLSEYGWKRDRPREERLVSFCTASLDLITSVTAFWTFTFSVMCSLSE